MSSPYEEIVEGETLLRFPPGERHELICQRLHERVAAVMGQLPSARLLPPRSIVQVTAGTMLRPDLALVTAGAGKLWLAAEVIASDDHRSDTVLKKGYYEQVNLPRLWMVDPRYDNVEVYHGTQYGLSLKSILAGKETLMETLLPRFQIIIAELFRE
ncbi:MAG TPA: Uma2 family endonuclease [Verrucomicrobiae bacterium]|nr:Uma2 family endonuclease [Verrucomicrobiae bacterium]